MSASRRYTRGRIWLYQYLIDDLDTPRLLQLVLCSSRLSLPSQCLYCALHTREGDLFILALLCSLYVSKSQQHKIASDHSVAPMVCRLPVRVSDNVERESCRTKSVLITMRGPIKFDDAPKACTILSDPINTVIE